MRFNFEKHMKTTLSLILLLCFSIGITSCTTRRSGGEDFTATENFDGDVFSDPFANLDSADPFGTDGTLDTDFTDDSFVLDTIDVDDLAGSIFDDVPADPIAQTGTDTICVPLELFPNLGATYSLQGDEFGCIDQSQVGTDFALGGAENALQLVLMQALHGFGHMQKCLQSAIDLDQMPASDGSGLSVVQANPQYGFLKAQVQIVQCYRQHQAMVAMSRAYEARRRAQMQQREQQYVQLLMMLLQDDE